MLADPGYQSFSHRHHAYVRRGQYAEQLLRLQQHISPERVHVIESESFFTRPEAVYGELLGFLGLPAILPDRFDRWNGRPSSPMSQMTRGLLRDHFDPHDQALGSLLGRAPAWLS
jgi:hypothetical protein